jgi:hypothetical protein
MARIAAAEVWTFRSGPEPDLDSLTGYEVEATDGGVGKVDSATADTIGSYLIVDTGKWIFGRKVLLPAGVVERVDTDEQKVYVDRTQEEIKNAPEFDADEHGDATEYRASVGDYYARG